MANPLTTNADIMGVVADFSGGVHNPMWTPVHARPRREGGQNGFFFRSVSHFWRDAWCTRPLSTRAVTVDTTPSQLVFCLENGLSPHRAGYAVAKVGSLNTLQLLLSRGYQLAEETSMGAAEGGQVELLPWLRANGCTWSVFATAGAATLGEHVDLLCSCGRRVILGASSRARSLHLVGIWKS